MFVMREYIELSVWKLFNYSISEKRDSSLDICISKLLMEVTTMNKMFLENI